MAELVLKYPDRFPAAVACLPMNDIDAALDEVDRAIKDLNFKGIQIYTPTADKPLDSPEFMPFYAKMSEYNLPIWMHPMRTPEYADYRTESQSKYGIYLLLGWPYETAVAMMRLVLSGVLEKYPNLKIITHHCGSMVPFFEQRLAGSMGRTNLRTGWDSQKKFSKEPIDYFKMFYNDTALCGSTPGLMCGYAFFGADHMLFGTDMPYDTEMGERNTRLTIKSIEQMDIPDSEKKKIFAGNARKLLRLR
jgi:aminocarboxymuconate-semialdehyde decarboxylase